MTEIIICIIIVAAVGHFCRAALWVQWVQYEENRKRMEREQQLRAAAEEREGW